MLYVTIGYDVFTDAKKRFSELLSVHVYSVQKVFLKVNVSHEAHTYYVLANCINIAGLWYVVCR